MKHLILILLFFNFANAQTDVLIDEIKQETQDLNTKTFNLLDSLKDENNRLQAQLDSISNIGGSGCLNAIKTFPYSQGFESDISDWKQSTQDDLDWIVKSGATPSSSTGATSAIEGSNYAYVEASGASGSPSKRAILTSPCYDLTGLTQPTFSFKYHQYGSSDMGSLDLEISDNNGSTWTSIWNSTGNKGDAWLTADIDVSNYKDSGVQFRFNRVTGSTWQSDICIDNISLTKEIVNPNPQPVKAFPTAEGFGKNATGGRGGKVIKVTNLNDSGAGSFRQAVQYTSGARTVVFEVGGTINLNSPISITNGDLTIAGQTGAGDGILLKNGMVSIEASNVIIRYLRFRIGSDTNGEDALSITSWSGKQIENIIIDHCSISWAVDENFNLRKSGSGSGYVRNITLQNSIISESTYGALSAADTYNVTYYKNMFAHNQERNVRFGYPSDTELGFEMINNLIYGCLNGSTISLGAKFTSINNHFKESSQQNMNPNIIDGTSAGQTTPSNTYACVEGNIIPNGNVAITGNLLPYLETTPYKSSGITAIPTSQVAGDIISHVGCSYPNRDAVDIRLINQFNANTGKIATFGTYPTINGGVSPVDSSGDGMPDDWKISNGLNPNIDDSNYVWSSGYVGCEPYINGLKK